MGPSLGGAARACWDRGRERVSAVNVNAMVLVNFPLIVISSILSSLEAFNLHPIMDLGYDRMKAILWQKYVFINPRVDLRIDAIALQWALWGARYTFLSTPPP